MKRKRCGNMNKVEIGKRFGLLTVLSPSDLRKGYWVCQCDCGTVKEYHSSNLRSGGTQSCGCMRTTLDLTGERYGMLTVLRKSDSRTGFWVCQCDCGNTKEISYDNLRSGHTKSCGCLRGRNKTDLTGLEFGLWTVLHPSQQKKYYWVCQCQCGTIKEISTSNLRGGKTRSCGCTKSREDLSGRHFGLLTVLQESETQHNNWICQCECGNVKEFSARALLTGLIESCGCVQMEDIDLSGRKIGKLTVLRRSEQNENFWICQCDCGNTLEIRTGDLRAGHRKSCGCSARVKGDLTGQRVGKLTVLRECEQRKGFWICQCDCGNTKEIRADSLRGSHPTKSCGCLLLEKIEDLTGKRFGKLTVLQESERKNYWICQCDCGNTTEVVSGSLRGGRTKSCGCLKQSDLTGQRFGKLTVLSKAEQESKGKGSYWICQCDCGKTTIVSRGNLKSGTKSCGCLSGGKIELEIGQRFGHWTVLREADQKGGYWLCKCDCGNVREVLGTNLRRGLSNSCGCKDGIISDLTDQKFGLLTVLRKSEDKTSYWICQCDCGNLVELHEEKLVTGHTKSCGCLKKKDMTGQRIGRLTVLRESANRKGFWFCKCDCGKTKTIRGSCLRQGSTLSCGCLLTESIERRKQTLAEVKTNPDRIRDCSKLSKNNTSGIRGVYYNKRMGVYVAKIGFQGITYRLKTSTDINVCAAARKEAEEAMYGNFLAWYDEVYGNALISEERKDFLEKKKQTDTEKKE